LAPGLFLYESLEEEEEEEEVYLVRFANGLKTQLLHYMWGRGSCVVWNQAFLNKSVCVYLVGGEVVGNGGRANFLVLRPFLLPPPPPPPHFTGRYRQTLHLH